jgi:peptidoglycan/LPS O-acetylase OafA/YrhL
MTMALDEKSKENTATAQQIQKVSDSEQKKPTQPKRHQGLDVLRGVAILLTITNHWSKDLLPGIPELSGWQGAIHWRLRGLGWTGVDLFFVLSGFLIGGLLVAELQKTSHLRVGRFLIRRGFKIWPSYFALLLVLCVTNTYGFFDFSSVAAFIKCALVRLFFLHNYIDVGPNGPTWTLAVEEHFYTTLPFFILLIIGLNHRTNDFRALPIAAIGVLIFIFALRCHHAIYGELRDGDHMFSHYRIDTLILGVLCQYAWRFHRETLQRFFKHRLLTWAIAILLIAPSSFLSRTDPFMFTIGFSMLAYGYAMILLDVQIHGFGITKDTKLIRATAAIGRYSYNIYLWHYFVPIMFSFALFPLSTAIGKLPLPNMLNALLQLSILMAISIFSGWLGTKIIETPFLNIRDKLFPSRTTAV